MSEPLILTSTHGDGTRRIGLAKLNRPKQLNALNDALMDELGAALLAFDADDGIGCIVVTGSEKAFAAGADIAAMAKYSYMDVHRNEFITRNWETVRRVRKPVIAAVAGFALGGGCELAMMCDFIIAADTARFGQPEIKIGIMPGAGGTQRLPRAVGKSKAMDMILTARMMDAAEAERAGLVSRVVPLDKLMDEAFAAAAAICALERPERGHGQGGREPRLRRPAVRRRDVRTAAVPLAVRHRRPEGRHGCLPEQAQPQLQERLAARFNSPGAMPGTGSRRGCWVNRSAASPNGRCRCRSRRPAACRTRARG